MGQRERAQWRLGVKWSQVQDVSGQELQVEVGGWRLAFPGDPSEYPVECPSSRRCGCSGLLIDR